MGDNIQLYEYLFAVRISLQDQYENESDIIRELKHTLFLTGILTPQINQILYEFYLTYGIDISINTIEQISITMGITNFFGFTINPSNNNTIDNNNNTIDDTINNNNTIDTDTDTNTDTNTDIDTIDDNANTIDDNANTNDANTNDVNTIDDNPNTFDDNANANTNNQPLSHVHIIQLLQNIPFMPSSYGFQTININNNVQFHQNPQMFTSNNLNNLSIGIPNSIINVFSNYYENVIPIPINLNNLSDVVVSTDKKDLESIKIIKLETQLDAQCGICMSSLNINDEVPEIKCEHVFHKDCIMPYLTDYNYKCPICRTELGNPHYLI